MTDIDRDAETLRAVLAQGARAMIELGWTFRSVEYDAALDRILAENKALRATTIEQGRQKSSAIDTAHSYRRKLSERDARIAELEKQETHQWCRERIGELEAEKKVMLFPALERKNARIAELEEHHHAHHQGTDEM